MGDAATVVKGEVSLFGRRMHRLEEIATLLTGLYGDLASTRASERQQKAAAYLRLLNETNASHGERQARASHETVDLDAEVLSLMGQIDQLREERDMLRFLVEWDAG